MPLTLLVLALVSGGVPDDSHAGVVRGQVWSETLKSPLPYATVEVQTSDGRIHGTYSDSTGVYLLAGIPAGRQLLRARHMDHALLEVAVVIPAGDTLSLDFSLELRPVLLPQITARGRGLMVRDDTTSATPADIGTAAVRALEATPGMAEMGLAEVGRHPGEPLDPSDVLFVRGASADLKLVLLDGAPVYAPFHLGGLVHAFEPGVLRSVNMYLGGAPVRYDGGLSYVLDLETRTGRREQLRIAGAADVMSARALAEGPIGPFGFLVAGRAVHGFGVSELIPGDFPYAYADGLARLHLPTAMGGVLGVTGFWNREGIALPEMPVPASQEASWGNRAFSLRYRGPFGDTPAELGLSVSEFDARLPIGRSNTRVADGSTRRLRVVTNFHTGPETRLDLSYGASLDILEMQYQVTSLGDVDDQRPIYRTHTGASVVGAYLEGAWEPVKRVRLRGGVRGDLFSLEPKPMLAPRLSVTWVVTDRAAVTIAGGQYRQYVREPESAAGSGPTLVLPEGSLTETRPLIISQASHFVIGLDQDLGEGLRAGVEGFYKHFHNVPSEATEDAQYRRGTAEGSGIDLWVRRVEGRLTGWFGYSLAWLWSTTTETAASHFSGRQLASAGITGPLGPEARFSLRLGYGAGLPYTALPNQDPRSSSQDAMPANAMAMLRMTSDSETGEEPFQVGLPDHPYLRLDAEMSRTWRFRGSSLEFTPYLRVLNALNRRDGLFYHFDREDTELRPLGALPIIPIVGMEWRF